MDIITKKRLADCGNIPLNEKAIMLIDEQTETDFYNRDRGVRFPTYSMN